MAHGRRGNKSNVKDPNKLTERDKSPNSQGARSVSGTLPGLGKGETDAKR